MSDAPELFVNAPSHTSSTEKIDHLPLAVRMRPSRLDQIAGQKHILGEGKLLNRTIAADRLSSLILYGPPGTGKTSLATVISKVTKSQFVSLNAVNSNLAELRDVIDTARKLINSKGIRTILFLDEIHRFNKAQQDVLMPVVETGLIILIGATTHNPSFVINGPLLSRALVFELQSLSQRDIIDLLNRAISDKESGFGDLVIDAEAIALEHIAKQSEGDARKALSSLEIGVLTTPPNSDDVIVLTQKVAEESCQRKIILHDQDGDFHYDLISAFIKSVRGSDVDSSIYWLAKMIYSGEDPRFILRRLIILASEDIGNADPQALVVATSALQGFEFVGMPEGRIILAQVVTYLALAPKSNASYKAIEDALSDMKTERIEPVPNHLRDGHYPGAKKLGHGKGYKYAHDYPGHVVKQDYRKSKKNYYQPTKNGFEKTLLSRLERIRSFLQ